MVAINISKVFRTKIDEGIYSFDINTIKESFIVELNESIGLSKEQMKEIGEKALDDSKNMESTIF